MLWAWGVGTVVWLLLSGAVAVTLGRGIRLADHRSSAGAAARWAHDGTVTAARVQVAVSAA